MCHTCDHECKECTAVHEEVSVKPNTECDKVQRTKYEQMQQIASEYPNWYTDHGQGD